MIWTHTPNGLQTNKSEVPENARNTVKLPGLDPVKFLHFTEIRGSGGNILYWQYIRKGPGVHQTVYTIVNDE